MRVRTVLAATLMVAYLGAAVQAEEGIPLEGGKVKQVSGSWGYTPDACTIGGKVYDGHGWFDWAAGYWVTFDVDGYAYFTGYAGLPDEVAEVDGKLVVELDGEVVVSEKLRHDEPARHIVVPLLKCRGLKITGSSGVRVGEPKLWRGTPPGLGTATGAAGQGTTAPHGPNPAPFAVDPNDLDKLAEGLRKAVDDNPDAKARLSAGKIAIATFNLVDIPSPAVATNVAEDLATAMIERQFRLVERGQLDKVLKELKLQNSGLVDPATAKEIGKQTGCSFILVGSVSDRGGFVVLNARLLDTQSGEAVAAKRVEMRKIPIGRDR